MRTFISAAAQFAIKPGQIEENLNYIEHIIETAAKEHQADLLVLPESITSGFAGEIDFDYLYNIADTIPGRISERLGKLAHTFNIHIIISHYEKGEKDGEKCIYNSAYLINRLDNKVIDVYRKTHLFPSERLTNGGACTRGSKVVVVDTELAKIGIIICDDGDFSELARRCALRGAEIIVRPSAFMRSFEIWELTSKARAYDNHIFVIACNSVGADLNGNQHYGHSMIISPIAQKLAQARGSEEIISAELRPDMKKYITYGSYSPQTFNHLEDLNPEAYK